MAKFVIELKNGVYERSFIEKLSENFGEINSKNMLLERSIFSFSYEKKIYAIIDIKPIIPNIPLFASLFMFFISFIVYLILSKLITILLIVGGIFLLLSFCWSKYFFYLLLKLSIKKYTINYVRLL